MLRRIPSLASSNIHHPLAEVGLIAPMGAARSAVAFRAPPCAGFGGPGRPKRPARGQAPLRGDSGRPDGRLFYSVGRLGLRATPSSPVALRPSGASLRSPPFGASLLRVGSYVAAAAPFPPPPSVQRGRFPSCAHAFRRGAKSRPRAPLFSAPHELRFRSNIRKLKSLLISLSHFDLNRDR